MHQTKRDVMKKREAENLVKVRFSSHKRGFIYRRLQRNLKKYPNCHSLETKRNGNFREMQRYKYLACGVQFSAKRRPKKPEQAIFSKYFYHK